MRFIGFIIILCVSLWVIPPAAGAQTAFFADPEAFNAPQNLNLPQNSNSLEFATGPAFSSFNDNQDHPRELEPETEFNYVIRDGSRPDTMPISFMNFNSALGFVAPTYHEADTPRLSQSGLWLAEHQGYGVTIQFIPGTASHTAEEIIQNAVLGIPSVTMNVQDAPLIVKVRVGRRGEAHWIMELLRNKNEIFRMDAGSEILSCGGYCG